MSGSKRGLQLYKLMEMGELVPVEVVLDLLSEVGNLILFSKFDKKKLELIIGWHHCIDVKVYNWTVKKNWIFAKISDFLIPISLHEVDFRYFKP